MKNRSTKILAIALAVVILASAAVIGTLAYLHAQTGTITNTFVVGKNITLKLEEDGAIGGKQTFEGVLPGATITKKASVAITSPNADCWLFVKVETTDLKNVENDETVGAKWAMADGWEETDENTGIFFRKVTKSNDAQSFGVLKNDQLVVSAKGLNDNSTMAFTAYAIQQENLTYTGTTNAEQAAEAWNILQNELAS